LAENPGKNSLALRPRGQPSPSAAAPPVEALHVHDASMESFVGWSEALASSVAFCAWQQGLACGRRHSMRGRQRAAAALRGWPRSQPWWGWRRLGAPVVPVVRLLAGGLEVGCPMGQAARRVLRCTRHSGRAHCVRPCAWRAARRTGTPGRCVAATWHAACMARCRVPCMPCSPTATLILIPAL
jgi:hypothetical protein